MTDTSGRQNKIGVPQVVKRRCRTMGIASLKEGSGCAVRRVDIYVGRLDKVKSSPSANDETTYLIMVLIEDERRGLPVELDGTSSSVNTLVRRRRHVDDMKRVEVGRMSGE